MSDTDLLRTVDSPQNINAFLAMIGGTLIPNVKPELATKVHSRSRMDSVSENKSSLENVVYSVDPLCDDVQVNEDSGNSTPKVASQAPSVSSSPATAGIRAPPPTPAARAIANENLTALEPIEEDGSEILTRLADESNLRLEHSNFAKQRRGRPVNSSFDVSSSSRPNFDGIPTSVNKARRMNMSSTQAELVDKMIRLQEVQGYEESVLTTFRQKHSHFGEQQEDNQAAIPQAQTTPMKENSVSFEQVQINDKTPFPVFEESSTESAGPKLTAFLNAVSQIKVTQDTQNLPEVSSNMRNALHSTPPQASAKISTSPSSVEQTKGAVQNYDQALERARIELASKVASQASTQGSPTIVVTCSTDEEDSRTKEQDEEQEDRENLKHFKQWGSPVARSKIRASVRKVILTGLPMGTDLTLVQSLISGGVIETFAISPVGQTAYVTFTAGEACEKFYTKYPNGIVFKFRGKTHTVFVDKVRDVDVVSGMLEGYLDCGASRCVRAVGADEDWAIKALQKLAEGAKGTRRVENIVDTYRNGIRSILFRFASISDAVRFKTMLVRDEDWEACNIQFTADPCENATGVHLE